MYKAIEGHRYQSNNRSYKVISCPKCGNDHVPHISEVETVWNEEGTDFERVCTWKCQLCGDSKERQTRRSKRREELEALLAELQGAK